MTDPSKVLATITKEEVEAARNSSSGGSNALTTATGVMAIVGPAMVAVQMGLPLAGALVVGSLGISAIFGLASLCSVVFG
jgi:recombinational DNA repair protein RecT